MSCIPLVETSFPDFSWFLQPCVDVHTFGDTVTPSRLCKRFPKGSLSPVDGGILDRAVTLGQLVQGAKCRSTWWYQAQRDVMSFRLRPLRSILSTVWSLWAFRGSIVAARTVGLEAGPPGSVAKDKARQQWWLEIVACTHLAVGPNCRCPCGGRGQVQTCLKRWAGTNYRLTGHCSVPECQCAFLLLQALPWGMHAAGRPVMGGGQARGAHRWANYR